MATTYIPKRPHKKSRTGCQNCKGRKIKCDEVQPACTFCSVRKISCVYLFNARSRSPSMLTSDHASSIQSQTAWTTPSSEFGDFQIDLRQPTLSNSLTPTISTSSGGLGSISELRLMHHYSTFTWKSIYIVDNPAANAILQIAIPQLAFENDFLMNGLLALTSAHLQYLVPDLAETGRQTDLYRAKTYSGFRSALSNLSPANYEAILVTGLLLVGLCSTVGSSDDEDDLCIIKWLGLHNGLNTIFATNCCAGIYESTIGPLFLRELHELSEPLAVPVALLDMFTASSDHPDEDDSSHEIYHKALNCIGILFSSLRSEGIGDSLSIRVVSWTTLLPADFLPLAKQKKPLTLAILAYYLVFMKLVPHLWWQEGIPDREILQIAGIVGMMWADALALPVLATRSSRKEEVAALLLGEPLISGFETHLRLCD